MRLRRWFQPPRQLLAVFLAMTMVSALALSWLGWRMIQQDRALEAQRDQERLELAADRAAAALQRRLAELEEMPQPNDDSLFLAFTPQGVEAKPALLYYPFVPPAPEADPAVFAAAESLEFRANDLPRAAEAFERLANTADARVRSGALMRLGRVRRKARQPEAALEAYAKLAKLAGVAVAGAPAELVARYARCEVLEETKKTSELQAEARAIFNDLRAGRWKLTRGQYEFYAAETARILAAEAIDSERIALARAAAWLYDEWNKAAGTRGRRQIWVERIPLFLIWRGSPERAVALVTKPQLLLRRIVPDQDVQLLLTDVEGRPVAGNLERGPRAIRTAAATQLPWTLEVASAHSLGQNGSLSRTRLLMAGLAVMLAFLVAGSYFVVRAVRRETEVARLQSDFVSAVSHEFRSPLTSMRQLSELLAAGRVPGEERRQQYYEVLAGESRRLQRLVESLLNFGRMEAGARQYRMEPLDPGVLVENVVSEFETHIAPPARIEVSGEKGSARVLADPEAISLALRNLLDNALKYSPACPTIWVEWAPEGERIAIRVRDRGLGISAAERDRIFQKFVRGAAATAANVKGTGVGLAMVRHVVTAHGGEIQLESEPGAGSTFTLLLPKATV